MSIISATYKPVIARVNTPMATALVASGSTDALNNTQIAAIQNLISENLQYKATIRVPGEDPISLEFDFVLQELLARLDHGFMRHNIKSFRLTGGAAQYAYSDCLRNRPFSSSDLDFYIEIENSSDWAQIEEILDNSLTALGKIGRYTEYETSSQTKNEENTLVESSTKFLQGGKKIASIPAHLKQGSLFEYGGFLVKIRKKNILIYSLPTYYEGTVRTIDIVIGKPQIHCLCSSNCVQIDLRTYLRSGNSADLRAVAAKGYRLEDAMQLRDQDMFVIMPENEAEEIAANTYQGFRGICLQYVKGFRPLPAEMEKIERGICQSLLKDLENDYFQSLSKYLQTHFGKDPQRSLLFMLNADQMIQRSTVIADRNKRHIRCLFGRILFHYLGIEQDAPGRAALPINRLSPEQIINFLDGCQYAFHLKYGKENSLGGEAPQLLVIPLKDSFGHLFMTAPLAGGKDAIAECLPRLWASLGALFPTLKNKKIAKILDPNKATSKPSLKQAAPEVVEKPKVLNPFLVYILSDPTKNSYEERSVEIARLFAQSSQEFFSTLSTEIKQQCIKSLRES